MSRPFIVIGDQTDHGGVVVGSTMTTDTHGKRLARVGDQVTCPKRGHGTTVIVTGDPTMIVDGAPVARHGDKCACGATLISSQFVSTVSDGGGAHSGSGAASRAAAGGGLQTGDVASSVLDEAARRPLYGHVPICLKGTGRRAERHCKEDGLPFAVRERTDLLNLIDEVSGYD